MIMLHVKYVCGELSFVLHNNAPSLSQTPPVPARPRPGSSSSPSNEPPVVSRQSCRLFVLFACD